MWRVGIVGSSPSPSDKNLALYTDTYLCVATWPCWQGFEGQAVSHVHHVTRAIWFRLEHDMWQEGLQHKHQHQQQQQKTRCQRGTRCSADCAQTACSKPLVALLLPLCLPGLNHQQLSRVCHTAPYSDTFCLYP
jgi:hypothetical protein